MRSLKRLLSLSLILSAAAVGVVGNSPAAAVSGFDSAYRFESAFLTGLKAGDMGQFSVFFDNTGTLAWATGTATQVDLAACLDDKLTCNIAPEEASWNPGTWASTTAYASQGKLFVTAGDFSAFTYSIKVPSDALAKTYTFNGDLVVSATKVKIHPEGYFQQATVTSAPASGARAGSRVRTNRSAGGSAAGSSSGPPSWLMCQRFRSRL